MKYSNDILVKLYNLASEDEYTDRDLATALEISRETFYTWKREKPDFSDTLKRAEEARTEEFKKVARKSLRKLLEGYEYEEVQQEGKPDPKNPKQVKVTFLKKTKKFVAPNPTSVIFALKNLDQDNFNKPDKHDITSKGESIKPDYSGLTTEEKQELLELIRKTKKSDI